MTKQKERCQLIALIVRWVARLSSLVIALVFIIFFIGEFHWPTLISLAPIEYVLLAFIPVIFISGTLVALKSELLGGLIMILSVIGYNIVSMIAFHTSVLELDFIFLIVPGILYVAYVGLTKFACRNIVKIG